MFSMKPEALFMGHLTFKVHVTPLETLAVGISAADFRKVMPLPPIWYHGQDVDKFYDLQYRLRQCRLERAALEQAPCAWQIARERRHGKPRYLWLAKSYTSDFWDFMWASNDDVMYGHHRAGADYVTSAEIRE